MDLHPEIEKFLSLLRAWPVVGGLEISDSALRFTSIARSPWRMTGLRLPPGILEEGRLRDRGQLAEALAALRQKISENPKSKEKINVVVSLSSVRAYSHVFNLPALKGEKLEEAVRLNVRMVSPADISEVYSDWQVVGADEKSRSLEVLSVFLGRSLVDETISCLKEAGFAPVAVESRALSLSRLVRQEAAGFDAGRPYLILAIDSAGLDFMVIRRGYLYFEYFASWRDVTGESREISLDDLKSAIVKNMRQVLNFYGSHSRDPVHGVFISAANLGDEVKKIISENALPEPRDIILKNRRTFSPEWFPAIGSALRGLVPRSQDRDVSLSGVGALEGFEREQFLQFSGFWRTLVPSALAILLAAFALTYLFLGKVRGSLEKASPPGAGGEIKEIEDLEGSALKFNQSVELIGGIFNSMGPKAPLIEKITELIKEDGLTLNRFTFQGSGAPLTLSAEAASEDQIRKFKKDLDSDPQFQSVGLPLSEIKATPAGLSFLMTFFIAPPKTP